MELQIVHRTEEKKPKYGATAAELLQRAREFYQDPENEKAFQEWKASKRKGEEKWSLG